MLTEESNPRTTALDSYSALEIVTAMNAEDATVATAVRGALPRIAQAVDAIVERLRAGGRMIYVGAGTSGRLGVLDAVECVPTFSVEPGLVIGLIAGGEIALTQAVEGAEDDRDAGSAISKRSARASATPWSASQPAGGRLTCSARWTTPIRSAR